MPAGSKFTQSSREQMLSLGSDDSFLEPSSLPAPAPGCYDGARPSPAFREKHVPKRTELSRELTAHFCPEGPQ